MSLRMHVVLDLIVIRGAAAIFVHRWRPGAAQKSRCHRNSTVCIQMYAWDPWTRLNGPESPLHVPRFQQRCLCTSCRDGCERIFAIQAVLKGRTVAIRKGNKHQLALFLLLEACQRNAAGWSTAGWPANAKLPLWHRHSSITRPCCLIERSSAKLLTWTSSTRQAKYASARRVNAQLR